LRAAKLEVEFAGVRINTAGFVLWEGNMRQIALGSVGFLGLLAGTAMAADLPPPPTPAPIYRAAPAVIAYFTWTGCYLGGNVGGLWANRDWNDQIPGDPLLGTDLGSYTTSGVLGGAQAGCNYQVGGWVFGLQGDYAWSNASGSNTATAFATLAPLVTLTDQSQVKSLASVTGRVGYSFDRFLAYVKAGGAWEQSNFSLLVGGATAATASETRGGWTVGIGSEYAFLDWLTGFIEYDYYVFGTGTNTFVCATCGLFAGSAPFNITTNISVLKVGLNLKFGPGARF
jgi:outer membrane immunogenic protein